jgi:hypothetical protein
MNASNDRKSGAVDQEMFEEVVCDNLSPEGVASIIAFLQPATLHKPATDDQRKALREVEWLVNTLIDLLGVDEYNRLLDELCL